MFLTYWKEEIENRYGSIAECKNPILIENIKNESKRWMKINDKVLNQINSDENLLRIWNNLSYPYNHINNIVIKEINDNN